MPLVAAVRLGLLAAGLLAAVVAAASSSLRNCTYGHRLPRFSDYQPDLHGCGRDVEVRWREVDGADSWRRDNTSWNAGFHRKWKLCSECESNLGGGGVRG